MSLLLQGYTITEPFLACLALTVIMICFLPPLAVSHKGITLAFASDNQYIGNVYLD